jgi:hypothetical protein
MAFACEQARGGIEADPARTRDVRLGPGVQIGEVLLWSRRTIERLFVRRQLHQVAGHEARSDAHVPKDLHQQPTRVAA